MTPRVEMRVWIPLVVSLGYLCGLVGSASAQSSELSLPATSGVTTGPPLDAVNLDTYYQGLGDLPSPAEGEWSLQCLPPGLMYRSYLGATKESRFAAQIVDERALGWHYDATLGTRVALLRYGTQDPFFPDGVEIQAEGSGQARLDLDHDVDLVGVDFRAGLPIVFGLGPHRTKFGYYHISSHLGDEFLLEYPDYHRLNFVRDVLILGYSYYPVASLRLYAEAGWAFHTDISQPWEFQFGLDYAPPHPTGFRGEPFAALNGHLREDLDFGGSLTAQAGWAWRGETGTLLRLGLHYYNGKSNQFSFFNIHEEQIGFGVWYDF